MRHSLYTVDGIQGIIDDYDTMLTDIGDIIAPHVQRTYHNEPLYEQLLSGAARIRRGLEELQEIVGKQQYPDLTGYHWGEDDSLTTVYGARDDNSDVWIVGGRNAAALMTGMEIRTLIATGDATREEQTTA